MSKEYDPKEFEKAKRPPLMFRINQQLGYLLGVVLVLFFILLLAVGIKWAITYLF